MRVSGCARRVVRSALLILSLCPPPASAQTAPDSPSEATVLFRFAAGGVVTTGPAISDGRIWFIADNKTLFVLTIDGRAIGKRELGYRKAQFLACDPFGRAILPEGPTGIMMVNRAGQSVWSYDLGAAPAGAPSFGPDGRLYIKTASEIVALSQNGRRLWSKALPSALSAPIATGPGGGPLIALADGSVALLSPDGSPLWEERFGAAAGGVAVRGDSVLVVAADGSAAVREPLRQPETPAGAKPVPAPIRLGSRPVSTVSGPDGFFVLGADGSLAALTPEGNLAWRIPVASIGAVDSLAAFADRVVALGKAGVASYDATGAFFRRLALINAASVPAVATTGAVFSGGADWIFYAYRFERPLEEAAATAPTAISIPEARHSAAEASLWIPGASGEDAVLSELDDIANSLESGTIGEDARRASSYAAAVALGLLERPYGSGAARPGPSPGGALPRARACELLGAFGSPIALPVLTEVFASDPDEAVRSAAALAIAAIGLDPEGEASRRFAEAAAGRLDERTALAVIQAIAELYRSNGGLDDPSGALALVRMMGSGYSRSLRSKAEAALRKISAAW